MYPFVLCYLFVGYMFAQKLFSNYPDKELFFSSGSYKSFLSDFPLWRGWGLSEEAFVIKTLNPHWSLTNYFQIHLFDLGDR